MTLLNQVPTIPAIAPAGSSFAMKSLRFNNADSAYLNRTFGTPTSQNIFTFSTWTKRVTLGVIQNLFGAGASHLLGFNSSDQLVVTLGSSVTSTAVFRDPSAWYHIVWVQNGTSVTVYVNNVSVATGTATNTAFNVNSTVHQIGAANTTNYYNGYMADIVFVDGTALTPSSFAQVNATTGQWEPKSNPTNGLTMGNNGFWLSFDNAASTTNLGLDDGTGARASAAGSNDWTPNNFSVTAGVNNDSLFDVPMAYDDGVNGRGNFCTLNPVWSSGTVSDGGLKFSGDSKEYFGTFYFDSGKWVWEVVFSAMVSSTQIGVINYELYKKNDWSWGNTVAFMYKSDGNKAGNGATVAYGATWTTNDVIRIEVDSTTGTIEFFKNGTSQGVAFNTGVAGKTLVPFVSSGSAGTITGYCNFGQRPFANTPTTGFKALCAQNLSTPTIIKPNQYFDVNIRAGTSNSGSVTGKALQPDLVWSKSRSARSHGIANAVRGTGLYLSSDTTGAEVSNAQTVTAFNSDGFSFGTNQGVFNLNGENFVDWLWKESATSGVDIVYVASASASAVNHSLGVKPAFIVIKDLSAGTNWIVMHKSYGTNMQDYYQFITNAAVVNSAGIWGGEPTTSQFYVSNSIVLTGHSYVAYLFAEVPGFSRISSYVGNGSVDGTFVWCGFQPKFVLTKDNVTSNWHLFDAGRSTYNVNTKRLLPNLPDLEYSANYVDFIANGFKMRSTVGNESAVTYNFIAFAESPFKYANAR